MTTAQQLVTSALRKIGEFSTGETLDADVASDGLSCLNTMLDSWSLERLMTYSVATTSYALTASKGSYTIGSGGDFNGTRPTKIVDPVYIRDSSGLDSPVQIIDAVAYGRIVDKDVDGSYPAYLYYDANWSATSTATVYLYPEPQANMTLWFNSWNQLANLSSLTTVLNLPPGYQRAIEFNLAVELASEYGREAPNSVMMLARQAKAAVKSYNSPDSMMRLDYAVSGTPPNILTGP